MRPIRKQLLPPLVIFTTALAIRLIYLVEIEKSPLFYYPQIDAEAFVRTARAIVDGSFFSGRTISLYRPPLYSAFLALFNDDLFLAHLAQLVIGSVSCVLIYRIGSICFSKRIGLLSGLAACLYWPFVYFEGEILDPALFIFLTLNFLLTFIQFIRTGKTWYALSAGLLLGLAAIIRPNILIFGWLVCPLFIIIPLLKRTSQKAAARPKLAHVLLFGVASICMIAPVTLFNYSAEGSFVLVSYNGGLNFYLGNNPDSGKTIALRPGEEWDVFIRTPHRENDGVILTGAERSRYWFRRVLLYIKDQPLHFLRNKFEQTALFLQAYETRRNLDIYFFRNRFSRFLSLPLWLSFAIIGPLALVGLILTENRSTILFLKLFVALYALSIIAFFVTARYRLPVIPIMIVFASASVFAILDIIKRRKVPWKHLALLAIAICLVNIDIFGVLPTPEELLAAHAESWYFLSKPFETKGDRAAKFDDKVFYYGQARERLEMALATDPGYVRPYRMIAWYDLKLATAVMEKLAQQSQDTENQRTLIDLAYQYLYRAEKQYKTAMLQNPQGLRVKRDYCRLLVYLNILDSKYSTLGEEEIRTRTAQRLDRIQQLSEELMHSGLILEAEIYHDLKQSVFDENH